MSRGVVKWGREGGGGWLLYDFWKVKIPILSRKTGEEWGTR